MCVCVLGLAVMWELKYALWQKDIGELGELDDSQVINYFARNSELTSKAWCHRKP